LNIQFLTSFTDKTQTVIIPISKSEISDTLQKIAKISGVSEELITQDFEAETKQTLTIYPQNNTTFGRLILLGFGEKPNAKTIRDTFRSFFFQNKKKLSNSLSLDLCQFSNLPTLENSSFPEIIDGIASASILASYDLGQLKNDRKEDELKFPYELNIIISKNQIQEAEKIKLESEIVAQAQLRVMELVDLPANKIDAQSLAKSAQESGEKYGYKVTVLQKEEIEENNLYALLAVNQGSEILPTFTIAEYKPESLDNTKIPVVGLVGKGITYDTGGLSMKPSEGMYHMKCDMGGGATVLGIVEAVARLKLPIHLIGIVPATDNNVDAKSVRPGDVIDSHAGLTIEVVNTDAEGRLVLIDGLSYLNKNYNPDILIDIATLTGASIVCLGHEAGLLCSNNQETAQNLMQLGEQTGEKVWQMPIWESYRKPLNSDVADIKNYPGIPAAGALTAAKFIEAFIDKHPKWAHLDIAGMAFGDSEFSKGKSATGYGVRLFVEYLKNLKPF